MKTEELKQLNNEVIMRHQKQPFHFGKQEKESILASNPICGDTFSLYLEESEDRIKQAGFHGFGCALSKASTSILMERLEGMDRTAAAQLCRDFLDATESDHTLVATPEIMMLVELKNHGGRMDCIKLAWKAVNEYLSK